MLKIKLVVEPTSLFLIHEIIQKHVRNKIAYSEEEKIKKSILEDLLAVISQKCKGYSEKPNGGKKYLYLKFHHAVYFIKAIDEELNYTNLEAVQLEELKLIRKTMYVQTR